MDKKKSKRARCCGDCIHEYACQAWNIGTIHFADASGCANYETTRDSTPYFIGYREGMNRGRNE